MAEQVKHEVYDYPLLKLFPKSNTAPGQEYEVYRCALTKPNYVQRRKLGN